MPYYFNPTYLIFMAPALLLMMYAQWRVQSAYRKWGQIATSRNIVGVQAAQAILQAAGLYGVNIQEIGGDLTDHYDPRSKTLRFSQRVGRGNSVASMAIVAHEIGHAQQDHTGYLLLRLRGGIVPLVNIGSQLGPILFFIGMLLNFPTLTWIGIIFFSGAFVFALITLPVELNASSRAMKMLKTSNLLVDQREMGGARAVLTAAALTYVAGMLTAFFQLLYYISLASGRSNRRN
ncbi:MAG: zinc metallopeptidase [Anaerolineae bacterium]|nr:zinc metallopeptidase [Anaerolineae bacterium]